MPRDLERGRRIYDVWGRHPRLYWAGDWPLFLGRRAKIRQTAIDALALEAGQAVLEIACGPGVNFAPIKRAIGPSGRLLALDYSEEMLSSARQRARAEGWVNIEFASGDAARLEHPSASFDAALCILALSVIPDHRGAIARVREALKVGGRFVVLDGGRLKGAGRLLNPVLRALANVSNGNVERDLVGDLADAFDEVSVTTVNAGTLFIATARKNRV